MDDVIGSWLLLIEQGFVDLLCAVRFVAVEKPHDFFDLSDAAVFAPEYYAPCHKKYIVM